MCHKAFCFKPIMERISFKPRWLYVFLFIILASQGRFISLVLLDSLLFSDLQIGIILGGGIISGILFLPFWTRRSDGYHGCLRVLTEITCLHAVSFSFLLVAMGVSDENFRFGIAFLARFFSASFIVRK